ncbi:hypothetical protein J6590_013165 [Homalodisca vitripennis]|nr:hypothetical protein J6590_013165 [Homalodisca vitripennis]
MSYLKRDAGVNDLTSWQGRRPGADKEVERSSFKLQSEFTKLRSQDDKLACLLNLVLIFILTFPEGKLEESKRTFSQS